MQIVKIESLLDIMKSKIGSISEASEIGTSETSGIKGVNKTYKLTNKKGDHFCFKPASQEHTSRWRYVPAHSQFRRERCAYLIDQKLGFGIVPETKIIKFKGEIGSIQEWVDAEHTPDITLQKYSTTTIWKVGLLDLLIGQIDRHKNNWLDYDHTVAAIDNGFSMPISAQANDPRSVILSRFAFRIWNKEIPQKFLDRIKLLKDTGFQKHIKNLLEPQAFQLFLRRVNELLNTNVAKVSGYRCVEKIHGIPKMKGEV